jgi:thiol-disulfide isomerase/thioredoxin
MTDEPPIPEPDTGRPSQDPTRASPLLSSRRLLQAMLLLVLVVPATLWLFRPRDDAEAAGPIGSDVGAAAPDFGLTLFDGTDFTLSSHMANDARPIVLNLWASWCVPCRIEMPAIDSVANRRPDILFLGIAVRDTEAAARAFADEVGVGYPLGYDIDGTILEKYPILGLPATWIIAGDGTVAAQFFGQLDEDTLTELIEENT